MQLWDSVHHATTYLKSIDAQTVVTVGNFDGIHRGHRAIIQRVLSRTREMTSNGKVIAVVLTFTGHTDYFWGSKPLIINTPEIRRRILADLGIDALLELNFDHDFAGLVPVDFLDRFLKKGLQSAGVVVGYDFKFGAEGAGDFQLLQRWGIESGVAVEQIPPVFEGETIISSSKIRELLTAGQIEAANRMLGYPFIIEGEIVRGEQRGRKLGFPTANMMRSPGYIMPRYGVYLVRFICDGESYFGIANVGVKPTFGTYDPLVEVFLFNAQLDLYAKPAQVEFLRFIRPEVRFTDTAALVAQMNQDVMKARDMMNDV